MKLYLATFAAPMLTIFMVIWALLVSGVVAPTGPDSSLFKAHWKMITECDLGDIDILGDSTSVADLIPSRIGPGVRDFGFNGGTPIEEYYVSQAMLRCPDRPKAVIVSFAPTVLSANLPLPGHPGPYFWSEGVKYGVIGMQDALQVLSASRKVNETLIVGPRSLFDIDYKVKVLLYLIKFPPYYSTDLRTYALNKLTGREAIAHAQNLDFFDRALSDKGHQFFGTRADGGNELDSDANRSGNLISPLADVYLRRMIEAFGRDGITVYFVEPPRDLTSAMHYAPSLISNYQSYLVTLRRMEPNFHIIDKGFRIWAPVFFGDPRHLNLRGASILSDDVRDALISVGQGSMTYPADDLKTNNLYRSATAAFWQVPAGGDASGISPALDISPPNLAYPPNPAWLYKAAAGANGLAIQAPGLSLDAKTKYAASVLVKAIDADRVSFKLNWAGGTNGSVTWDFSQREISYSGTANAQNSGVTICPGGWAELFLSAASGPKSILYPGPIVSLSAMHDTSAYLYNATLERGLWPTNYCTLQGGEEKTIPLPAEATARE